MTSLEIPTARVFRPLLEPKRYKGAHGGRGSGKSHFFAELLVEDCLRESGLRAVCIREFQRSLVDSSREVVITKTRALGVADRFTVYRDRIDTPGGGSIIFIGMNDQTAESVKSLEGFKRAWVDEAQSLSARSLSLLRPTIRAPGSELWFSWNRTRKADAVDEFFRLMEGDKDAACVKANWRDNPWFPAELESERQREQKIYPERYDHIWEGNYAAAFEGAYFAAGLSKAKQDGRIGKVAIDPVLPVRAFFDLGGSGANADAMAIWIAQWVGQEIRVLDYIEGIGQPLGYYVGLLRSKGWHSDQKRLICHLPHDGINTNNITGKQYKDHLAEAGFDVPTPTPNQGRGAASMRIEAVRRLLPKCWFDAEPTEAGRDALGYYHERKDEVRNVGLGPEHDWSSHAADAFGLMCVCYEEPSRAKHFNRKLELPRLSVA